MGAAHVAVTAIFVFIVCAAVPGCSASRVGSATGQDGGLDVIVHEWGEHLQDAGAATHPPLVEMSGIARSRTYPDVWWVHNDSGDEPRLYAINSKAQVVMPPWQTKRHFADSPEEGKKPWPGILLLNSTNQDWEDITLLDGRLYVCEVGNNGNAKPDLGFYVVNEPNPLAIDLGVRPIAFIPIAYPDQHDYPPLPPDDWRFDCEAVFVSDGKLYLLTKYRADQQYNVGATGTTLYRLDTMHADRVNTLTLIHRADGLPIVPTGADLSPDGRRLAVMSYDSVWLFEKPEKDDDWLSGRATQLKLPKDRIKQAEGLCWDGDNTLRINNEQRGVLTLDVTEDLLCEAVMELEADD